MSAVYQFVGLVVNYWIMVALFALCTGAWSLVKWLFRLRK